MQGLVAQKRCQGCEGHADVVRSRISKVSRMPTIPKGTRWKTPVVLRASVISVVSRVSGMSEGMPDEMVGRNWQRSQKAIVHRYKVSSRRSGRYTRMTGTRRAPKGAGRYLCRKMTEGSGVCRFCDPIFRASKQIVLAS